MGDWVQFSVIRILVWYLFVPMDIGFLWAEGDYHMMCQVQVRVAVTH